MCVVLSIVFQKLSVAVSYSGLLYARLYCMNHPVQCVFSTSGDVQYIWGCSVHQGDTMSTLGGYHDYIGRVFSTLGGYHDACGGYHEYIRGYHEYIASHASWFPPDVLMISPGCTYTIPPMYWTPLMYSRYPSNVLMVSPWCTEYPLMYWTHIIQGMNSLLLPQGSKWVNLQSILPMNIPFRYSSCSQLPKNHKTSKTKDMSKRQKL